MENNYPQMPNGLLLTEEFKKAYDLLEHTKEFVFLTGDAGSGKTTFLKWWLSNTSKKTVVLSPTGMGAVNLLPIRASTIHKFFKFGNKPLFTSNIPRLSSKNYNENRQLYLNVDTIIIDECSMVSSMMMQAIDDFYRINFDSDEPFGGKQIVLVGDMAQLPPVLGSDAERQYTKDRFGGKYFFDATIFKEVSIKFVEFTEIFRQNDPEFIGYLNKIRTGTITQDDIIKLNDIFTSNKVSDDAMIISFRNDVVDQINDYKLNEIKAEDVFLYSSINGFFNPKSCPVKEITRVRPGCRIMCRNNDKDERWVNGTIAKFVKKVSDEKIIIELEGGDKQIMEKVEFTDSKFEYNPKTGEIEAKETSSMTCFPIVVSYAMTAHKSQGITLDEVKIDIGRGAFDTGQLYVALSRCRSMRGIQLISNMSIRDVKVDDKIYEFYKKMRENNGVL